MALYTQSLSLELTKVETQSAEPLRDLRKILLCVLHRASGADDEWNKVRLLKRFIQTRVDAGRCAIVTQAPRTDYSRNFQRAHCRYTHQLLLAH